jgi:hypothetical protein
VPSRDTLFLITHTSAGLEKPLNKRARKRLRQREEGEAAKRRFRYGLLAHETLRDHAFNDLGHSVVDVEVIPDLEGRPDDMWAWLIFETPEEAEAARREPTLRDACTQAAWRPRFSGGCARELPPRIHVAARDRGRRRLVLLLPLNATEVVARTVAQRPKTE